jgi:hypothetical protein
LKAQNNSRLGASERTHARRRIEDNFLHVRASPARRAAHGKYAYPIKVTLLNRPMQAIQKNGKFCTIFERIPMQS